MSRSIPRRSLESERTVNPSFSASKTVISSERRVKDIFTILTGVLIIDVNWAEVTPLEYHHGRTVRPKLDADATSRV
jgi:hypothetical protein